MHNLCYIQESLTDSMRAGSKARLDVERILESAGSQPIDLGVGVIKSASLSDKLKNNIFIRRKMLRNFCRQIREKDSLLLQYPAQPFGDLFDKYVATAHSVGVEVIVLVHDLITLRDPAGCSVQKAHEEIKSLKTCEKIIVHTEKMKDYLIEKGCSSSKFAILGPFDYLDTKTVNSSDDSIIIAGNLSPKKSSYIYQLDSLRIEDIHFNLYGPGFDRDSILKNASYIGSFKSSDLVENMNGAWGLVWDGDSIFTCSGNIGTYLPYVSQHKASLYMSACLPIIVWRGAGIADYIVDNNIGVAVDSLEDLGSSLPDSRSDQYIDMKHNLYRVSKLLHEGHYLLTAIGEIL